MMMTLPYSVVRYLPLAALTGTALLIVFGASAQTYISDADAARYAGDSYVDGRYARDSIAGQMSRKLGIYVGADYSRSMTEYDNGLDPLQENLNGANIYVGLPLMEKLSLELGYSRTEQGQQSYVDGGARGETKNRFQAVTADLVGNLPLNQDNSLKMLVAAGVGGYRFEASNDAPGFGLLEGEDDAFAVRLGLGAQWQLTDTLGLRGMVRYVKPNFEDDVVDYMLMTDVGLNLTF